MNTDLRIVFLYWDEQFALEEARKQMESFEMWKHLRMEPNCILKKKKKNYI